MSRLKLRPRPLDAQKKIPTDKAIKKFEDDHNQSLRTNPVSAISPEEHQAHNRESTTEIPIPKYIAIESYERDYPCTFRQPPFYIRSREARSEVGDFAQYDLDNEDEDWLKDINYKRKILPPEKLETILFKLEVLDHKARGREGVLTSTVAPVPVLLELDSAVKALEQYSLRLHLLQSIYYYWKAKREKWQKPILRQLQPPPPLYDTDPYNVFRVYRPSEEAHCNHTRKMRRRESNVPSFENLRFPVSSF